MLGLRGGLWKKCNYVVTSGSQLGNRTPEAPSLLLPLSHTIHGCRNTRGCNKRIIRKKENLLSIHRHLFFKKWQKGKHRTQRNRLLFMAVFLALFTNDNYCGKTASLVHFSLILRVCEYIFTYRANRERVLGWHQ